MCAGAPDSGGELEQTLVSGLRQLEAHQGVLVERNALPPLLSYVQLLNKWNRVYNLTAVREPKAMIQRHILDSLVLCRWLPVRSKACTNVAGEEIVDVLDIGSGAGLPVLPLAIARPDLQFASVESNGKKTRFQQQVLLELGLTNVHVLNLRIQDVQLRAACVTSRAFTAPHGFLSIASEFCLAEGTAIVMLGQRDRLPEPLPHPYALEELLPLTIPGICGARHIAVCRRLG